MRAWCVLGSVQQVSAFASHEAADPTSFAKALEALDRPASPDPARLAACRAGLDRQVADALGQVETLNAAGKRDAAKARLLEIDKRFGGLAAPRSVELWRGD
jgi:hypothetical protein